VKDCSENIEETEIVRIGVAPLQDRPKEMGRFHLFFESAWSYLQTKVELAEQYARAKMRFVECETEVKVQEAAKLAAEAQKQRLENAKTIIDIVDANLTASDPETGKALTMAALLEASPELAAQATKIAAMLEDLRVRRGTVIEFTRPDGRSSIESDA